MPSVDVKMWKGFSKDTTEQIISGITKVFVELGIPERAVEVVVHEIPKSHWGIGGKPSLDMQAESTSVSLAGKADAQVRKFLSL